jgi:hypothetical protein
MNRSVISTANLVADSQISGLEDPLASQRDIVSQIYTHSMVLGFDNTYQSYSNVLQIARVCSILFSIS